MDGYRPRTTPAGVCTRSPSYVPDITVEDHADRGSTLVVQVSVFRPTASPHVDVACSGKAI